MKTTVYTNQGKGLVLENKSTAYKLLELFNEKSFWENTELNDILGWQFSQAVYSLRKKGLNIQTEQLGNRRFGYRLIES